MMKETLILFKIVLLGFSTISLSFLLFEATLIWCEGILIYSILTEVSIFWYHHCNVWIAKLCTYLPWIKFFWFERGKSQFFFITPSINFASLISILKTYIYIYTKTDNNDPSGRNDLLTGWHYSVSVLLNHHQDHEGWY